MFQRWLQHRSRTFLLPQEVRLDSIILHKKRRHQVFLSFNFAGKIMQSITHAWRNRVKKEKEKMALLAGKMLYPQNPMGAIESLERWVNSLEWTNLTMLIRSETKIRPGKWEHGIWNVRPIDMWSPFSVLNLRIRDVLLGVRDFHLPDCRGRHCQFSVEQE